MFVYDFFIRLKLCCLLNSVRTRGWAKYTAKNYAVCWILLESGGERNILKKTMLFAEFYWNPGVSEIICKKLCCLLNSIGTRGWTKYSTKNYAVYWTLLEPGGEWNILQKTMLFAEFYWNTEVSEIFCKKNMLFTELYWNPGVSEIFCRKLCCLLNFIVTRGWAKYSAKKPCCLLNFIGTRGWAKYSAKTMLFAEFYWIPGVSEYSTKTMLLNEFYWNPGGERNILQKLCC